MWAAPQATTATKPNRHLVLDHAAIHIRGVDLVFDFVAVVGEAEVALAQPSEMRGEIEIVADFPVGAFFRLCPEFYSSLLGFKNSVHQTVPSWQRQKRRLRMG